jgi:uncharacterized membrane protein YkoI
VVAVVIAVALRGTGAAAATVGSPVGITRAQTVALAAAPGLLVDTTLALDRGRLVYRVEIQTAPDMLTHVEVDAGSAKVLRVAGRRARSPFPAEVEAP